MEWWLEVLAGSGTGGGEGALRTLLVERSRPRDFDLDLFWSLPPGRNMIRPMI